MRVALDRIATAAGLTWLSERAMRDRLTLLTYHRVLPDDLCPDYPLPSLVVPESVFEAQVALIRARYEVVTLEHGLAALREGEQSTRPRVALTFDDGYADNALVAAPILRQHGVLATFYVVAGLIGTDDEFWYDAAARRWFAASPSSLARAAAGASVVSRPATSGKAGIGDWMAFLKRLPPAERASVIAALPDPGRPARRSLFDRLMKPEQLAALQRDGHAIGSHSMTHPLLPQLSDAELDHELSESRRKLEAWLNAPIRGFCYPNGDHDDRIVAAALRAGYSHGCTTLRGDNSAQSDPMRLRRVDMNPARTITASGAFHEPSFRALVSRLHEFRR